MPLANELQSQFSAPQTLAIQGSSALTVIAAGATQATATALPAANNIVSTATLNQGVILPGTRQPFDQVNVANTTTVTICVYPPVGGNINGQATNAPCILAANYLVTFFSTGGNNWLADSI